MRSCSALSRPASPWIAATAQMRRARRSRANRSRPRGSGAADGGDSGGRTVGVIGPPLARRWSGGVQYLLNAPDRGRLIDPLDGGEFPHQPVERRLVDLPLAIGLLGLTDIAVEVPHDLRDRRRVAGIDLRLVF